MLLFYFKYVSRNIEGSRFIWNNYKSNNRKYLRSETPLQEHLLRYFLAWETVRFSMFLLHSLIKNFHQINLNSSILT